MTEAFRSLPFFTALRSLPFFGQVVFAPFPRPPLVAPFPSSPLIAPFVSLAAVAHLPFRLHSLQSLVAAVVFSPVVHAQARQETQAVLAASDLPALYLASQFNAGRAQLRARIDYQLTENGFEKNLSRLVVEYAVEEDATVVGTRVWLSTLFESLHIPFSTFLLPLSTDGGPHAPPRRRSHSSVSRPLPTACTAPAPLAAGTAKPVPGFFVCSAASCGPWPLLVCTFSACAGRPGTRSHS